MTNDITSRLLLLATSGYALVLLRPMMRRRVAGLIRFVRRVSELDKLYPDMGNREIYDQEERVEFALIAVYGFKAVQEGRI